MPTNLAVAIVIGAAFIACHDSQEALSAPSAPLAVDADPSWVPTGEPKYDECVETARASLIACPVGTGPRLETCLWAIRHSANTMCSRKTARYARTGRPIRAGDYGGCLDSWTLLLSADCCTEATDRCSR